MSKPDSKTHKTKKDMDVLLSRLNALEASTTDNFQKSIIGVLRAIIEAQSHSLDEFEHLKKAIDLLTLQLFKLDTK